MAIQIKRHLDAGLRSFPLNFSRSFHPNPSYSVIPMELIEADCSLQKRITSRAQIAK